MVAGLRSMEITNRTCIHIISVVTLLLSHMWVAGEKKETVSALHALKWYTRWQQSGHCFVSVGFIDYGRKTTTTTKIIQIKIQNAIVYGSVWFGFVVCMGMPAVASVLFLYFFVWSFGQYYCQSWYAKKSTHTATFIDRSMVVGRPLTAHFYRIYTDANGQRAWVCISMPAYWAMFCQIALNTYWEWEMKSKTHFSYGAIQFTLWLWVHVCV